MCAMVPEERGMPSAQPPVWDPPAPLNPFPSTSRLAIQQILPLTDPSLAHYAAVLQTLFSSSFGDGKLQRVTATGESRSHCRQSKELTKRKVLEQHCMGRRGTGLLWWEKKEG